MKAKRLIAVALTALSLLVACGNESEPVRGDSEESPSPADQTASPRADASPTAEPDASEEQTAFVVWFANGDELVPERRHVLSTPGIGAAAMRALLSGPSGPEVESGYSTAIPGGTELNDLSISDGTARVDLSGTFDDGGGSLGMKMRLAQVVYTLTQFPTVSGVEFLVDGERVETFSGEGIVLDGPQKRKDFEEHLPAISVESPLSGDEVGSTFTVTGTANVFEANVSIEVLAENGERLIQTFTTATCGTGCRGTFEQELQLPGDLSGSTIELKVYESSAEDGRPTNVVRIPLTVE